MNEILTRISNAGIIPVVKIEAVENAIPLATALKKGGLPCIEITFRTIQAEESIKLIANAFPDMLVGAGTVLTKEQVDKAIAAGAKFIVSPGINHEIVKYCIDRKITVIPGCANPTDIEVALGLGLDVVKFFPAEALGGVKLIKALSAPYNNIKFIPTGGINENNLNEYLSCPSVLACGGSWMVNEALIKSGEFDKITTLTSDSVSLMNGFELAHIGINNEDAEKALQTAKLFGLIFGKELHEGISSIFIGKSLEIMKTPFRGKNGHIAIATNNVERSVSFMESLGFKMDMARAISSSDGKLKAVYFEEEISGFAIHLVQK